MRILLINCYHFKKGGAETAYFDTARILKEHGHEVAFFSMKHPQNLLTEWEKYFVDNINYNDSSLGFWQKIKTAGKIVFNFQAKRNLEKLIQDFRPDVAHLHNIYHQLSPSVIYALKKHGVPMVMTLHDYKLISPNYNLFLNGKIWEGKSALSCIMDKCIKDSYIKSTLAVVEKIIHDFLGSYANVDLFISPSRFLAEKFKKEGFSKEIRIIRNPIKFPVSKHSGVSKDYLLYFGRLSEEKGVKTLILAMKELKNKRLAIVGDGPEKEKLQKMVKDLRISRRVKFWGYQKGTALKELISGAQAVVIPSIWYENMPYAAIEALSMGKIVIASKIGGLTELISNKKNGFLFEPENTESLVRTISTLPQSNLPEIAARAQKSILDFSFETYYRKIIFIYNKVSHAKNSELCGRHLSLRIPASFLAAFFTIAGLLYGIRLYLDNVILTEHLMHKLEMQEIVHKMGYIVEDLENKEDNILAGRESQQNEKEGIINDIHELDLASLELRQKYLDYLSDTSLRYYPLKSRNTERYIQETFTIPMISSRVVRSAEDFLRNSRVEKKEMDYFNDCLDELKWHLNNVSSL